jgi:hypothetical protein
MASTQRLRELSDRHMAKRESLLVELIKMLLALWAGFDGWDDPLLVKGMAARSATLSDAALVRVRRLQRSYLLNVLAADGLAPRDLPAVQATYPRANVFATEVHQRPVTQYVWARRNGATDTESDEAFKERLRAIAQADILAAEREEAERILQATPEVIGYRRIIHPERSRSGTCGLCAVAATQFYRVGELMPIHPPIDYCDVAPVTATSDPGLKLNRDDLRDIYLAAGGTDEDGTAYESTRAEELLNVRVTVQENGELGPLLVKRGDHFRDAEEAGRPKYRRLTDADRREMFGREIVELDRSADEAQARLNAGADADRLQLTRSIKYMRERSAALKVLLNSLAA